MNVYFLVWSVSPTTNMEMTVFMTFVASIHQRAIKMICLHFWRTVTSSIFISHPSIDIFCEHLRDRLFKDKIEELRIKHLSEFLDVAEFQIGDDEEYDRHNSQSHVVLPQAPGGVLYSQVVQILLSCASERRHVPFTNYTRHYFRRIFCFGNTQRINRNHFTIIVKICQI